MTGTLFPTDGWVASTFPLMRDLAFGRPIGFCDGFFLRFGILRKKKKKNFRPRDFLAQRHQIDFSFAPMGIRDLPPAGPGLSFCWAWFSSVVRGR